MEADPARAAAITRRLDPRLLKLAAGVLDADELHLSLWLREERHVETLTSHGSPFEADLWPLDRFPLTERVLTTGRPEQVLAGAPDADPAEVELLGELGGFRALLMVPVSFHGEVVGLLEVFRREEIGWTPAQLERATLVCGQLGATLAAMLVA